MIDMTGRICGNWRVLGFWNFDKKLHAYWLCECLICGNIKPVRGDNLRRGTSTKCIHCAKKR